MSAANFIPEVTSADLQLAYSAAQIVIPTLNQDFEGDAKAGNSIRIVGAATPTIVDYKAAGHTINPATLTQSKQNLLLDQEKAFSFLVDDVDAAQAAGSLDPETQNHGQALAEDAEAFAIKTLIAGGTVLNPAGTGAVVVDTATKAKAALRKIRTELTKAKVPVTDRFVAVNPAMADLLIEDLSDASKAGGDAELRNGQIAKIYGLIVLESPHFAEAAKPVAVGYHSKAAAFVSQLANTEAVRSTTSFGDIVRGLNVYGAKVTRSAGVAVYAGA